ncbi:MULTISPECIES: ABC transporter ATP-binding protein [Caldisericum]|jgi:oligopeptide/dipeptide ABC transporter ATP-binding protein|uniref:Peptide ABC transporter ATP-binding protein n=1 Tax=Caldisericum exile TaxID=693075 RepID=A0A2J6WFG2_9BACT|nr:MAG: peptide ABC transporter ATP-binding protein [Caldisericum exile]
MEREETLLDVRNLKTYFFTDDGVVKAVDGMSFTIRKGEVLGLVGESGCGKSVASLSIMQLVEPPGKIVEGEIIFKGEDLLKKTPEQMRKIRGSEIAMIFQEPMTSLNPVYTIGNQIMEAILIHQDLSEEEAKKRTIELLRLVGIPEPERRFNQYPHELSGGMRQRVMIAMAMSCNPDLLISDEATTALDVTIQAQILELMKDLQRKTGMAILFITHDLALVAEMAHSVAVAYTGKIVEYGDVYQIFKKPRHPYTYGLLSSVPSLKTEKTKTPLPAIEGMVPNPYKMPSGCHFNPRCPFATERCRKEMPELAEIEPGHLVRCFHPVAVEKEAVS